jgi:hypothetical protein
VIKKILATGTMIVAAAQGCGGTDSPSRSAAYAGDGNTQFGTQAEGVSGKLKWGVVYKAVYENTTDRQNCKWSLYTINSNGVANVVKRGNYFNAKIKVEKPNTVKVYLKSIECGLWKPA